MEQLWSKHVDFMAIVLMLFIGMLFKRFLWIRMPPESQKHDFGGGRHGERGVYSYQMLVFHAL